MATEPVKLTRVVSAAALDRLRRRLRRELILWAQDEFTVDVGLAPHPEGTYFGLRDRRDFVLSVEPNQEADRNWTPRS